MRTLQIPQIEEKPTSVSEKRKGSILERGTTLRTFPCTNCKTTVRKELEWTEESFIKCPRCGVTLFEEIDRTKIARSTTSDKRKRNGGGRPPKHV